MIGCDNDFTMDKDDQIDFLVSTISGVVETGSMDPLGIIEELEEALEFWEDRREKTFDV